MDVDDLNGEINNHDNEGGRMAPEIEEAPLQPRTFLGFSTPTGGAPTGGKPTEAKDAVDEIMMALPATQPVTKLELDKCKKRLTFAECSSSPSEEIVATFIDHVPEDDEDDIDN